MFEMTQRVIAFLKWREEPFFGLAMFIVLTSSLFNMSLRMYKHTYETLLATMLSVSACKKFPTDFSFRLY